MRLLTNKRVLAHSCIRPLQLAAPRVHNEASCPSRRTQASDDTYGALTPCLPYPVLIPLITCVGESDVDMHRGERSALGHDWSTEMEVVEIFDRCGLDMTRVQSFDESFQMV